MESTKYTIYWSLEADGETNKFYSSNVLPSRDDVILINQVLYTVKYRYLIDTQPDIVILIVDKYDKFKFKNIHIND